MVGFIEDNMIIRPYVQDKYISFTKIYMFKLQIILNTMGIVVEGESKIEPKNLNNYYIECTSNLESQLYTTSIYRIKGDTVVLSKYATRSDIFFFTIHGNGKYELTF
jgi:hypothetical protein